MDDLWNAYWQDRSDENRNALVVANMGLVEQQAYDWFKRRNRHSFYLGDFITWGSIGLLQAVERFNPRLGVKFSTYAFAAIRHAIINGVNMAVANTQRTTAKKQFAKRFERLGSYEGSTPDPVQSFIHREHNRYKARKLIHDYIADWQREAFELYYLEGLDAQTIADRMNLKPTRVHQMLCMGRQRIKAALDSQGK